MRRDLRVETWLGITDSPPSLWLKLLVSDRVNRAIGRTDIEFPVALGHQNIRASVTKVLKAEFVRSRHTEVLSRATMLAVFDG